MKSKNSVFYLDRETQALITELAKNMKVSKSAIVRLAVKKYKESI